MTDQVSQANQSKLSDIIGQIKWDSQGLAPAIVQDLISKDVLMLAYVNRDSLQRTVETGETWFWSRSRAELWHKGATSGNIQKVKVIKYDCDADTLLIGVIPEGPACHTGEYTCFNRQITVEGGAFANVENSAAGNAASTAEPSFPLNHVSNNGEPLPDRFAALSRLETVIAKRDMERPEGAYTTYLLEKGIDKILKKVGEEATEVIIAAKNRDNDELRYEISDLIFHTMVLMRDAKLPLDDVMRELDSRHIQKETKREKKGDMQ